MSSDLHPRSVRSVAACMSACIAVLAVVATRAAEMPEAGGLTALPDVGAAPVPLANPGFEDGTDAWCISKDGPLAAADSGARTGKGCLRFDASIPYKYTPSARQELKTLDPGVYTLRFWAKASGLKKPVRGTAGVRVSVEYKRKNGARGAGNGDVLNGTFDWRQIELGLLVPDDVDPSSGVISIHRYNKPASGEARFDDFTLEHALAPPIEAYLRYPNYRGYLAGDGPQIVRLWVRVNDIQAPGIARVEVTEATGGGQVATMPVTLSEQVVEFDATAWPTGRYLVRARIGDHSYPAYAVQKITAEQRKAMAVWFDESHVLHIRGKKVFPLGLYNTTKKFDVVDDGEFARLNEMAEAPVNVNINYWWWPGDMATRRTYLAEMQKRGMGYLDTVMPFTPWALSASFTSSNLKCRIMASIFFMACLLGMSGAVGARN